MYFDPIAKIGAISALNTVGLDETGPDSNGLRVAITTRLLNELFPLFRADAAADGGN